MSWRKRELGGKADSPEQDSANPEPNIVESTAAAPEPQAMRLLLSRRCSRDEFMLLMARLVGERMPGFTVEPVTDSELRIISPEGKGATTYLENIWRLYERLDEAEREGQLERHMRVIISLHAEPVPLLREQIVASIKDDEYLCGMVKHASLLYEPLCSDLYVVYMQDLPDRMGSIKPESLEGLGIGREEVRAIAKENLKRIMGPANQFGDGPWYMLSCGDYTASLLIMEKLWNHLAEDHGGEIVAVAPARDVICYTTATSEDGLREIKRIASEIVANGNHVISETLLVWRGGRWQPFRVQ